MSPVRSLPLPRLRSARSGRGSRASGTRECRGSWLRRQRQSRALPDPHRARPSRPHRPRAVARQPRAGHPARRLRGGAIRLPGRRPGRGGAGQRSRQRVVADLRRCGRRCGRAVAAARGRHQRAPRGMDGSPCGASDDDRAASSATRGLRGGPPSGPGARDAVVTATTLSRILDVSFPAASAALDDLRSAGILTTTSIDRGATAFICRDVLDLVTKTERQLASTRVDTRAAAPNRPVPGRPQQ